MLRCRKPHSFKKKFIKGQAKPFEKNDRKNYVKIQSTSILFKKKRGDKGDPPLIKMMKYT